VCEREREREGGGGLEYITYLNKPKTLAVSCLEVKRQLHKLHRTKWFKNLSKYHKQYACHKN
jgi:hypothetical protein